MTKALGREMKVDAWRVVDHQVLGPICAFTLVDRARSKAFRGFNVRERGYRVICEADETADAEALCDAYLGSATRG